MTNDPLHYLTIESASELIAKKDLSPVELTEALLARIADVDGELGAYVTSMADEAMAMAKIAENEIAVGNYKGPLHGIPVAFKDLFDAKGVRTTASSKVMEHYVPTEDATVVARLRAAGSVFLGKLAMSEFAAGGNPSLFADPVNPWDVARSPGGSSSGSGTAISAGMALGALGSDTGGSIRGPASFCGIVGLKPSYGLLSRKGVVPLSWSLDCAGPMTRTVEDTAVMLQAMAGFDSHDISTSRDPVPNYNEELGKGVSGIRIGLPRHLYHDPANGVASDVIAAVDEAAIVLEKMGAKVEEVELPIFRQSWIANTAILLTEGFAYHRENLKLRPKDFGDQVRTVLYLGGLTSGVDYVQAQRVRAKTLRDYAKVMEKVDVILMPTTCDVAPQNPIETIPAEMMVSGLVGEPGEKSVGWTAPFNLLGAPSVSLPCGFNREGMPIGLQVAGRRLDDATVLRVAYAYQEETGWHLRRPKI